MQVDACSRNRSRKSSKHRSVQRKHSRIYTNPFLNFIRDFRKEMQGKHMSPTQVTSMAGRRWREMTPEERLPYIELAQQARKAGGNKRPKKPKTRKGKKREEKERRHRARDEDEGEEKPSKKCNYCGTFYTSDLPPQMSCHTSATSVTRSYSRTSCSSDGSDR